MGMRSSAGGGMVTGLRICSNFMEWTTLRESKNGIEMLDSGNVELAVENGESKEAPNREEQIKQHCSRIKKSSVAVAIAPDKMLMRVTQLPASDPVEITNMVQLQVDAFSPFPDERMSVSHEVLSAGDAGTRVLIGVAQKELIESTGAILKSAGLDVQRIDAEIMAWWQLFSVQPGIPEEGRCLILVSEPCGGAWLVVEKREPLAFRAISPAGGLSADEYAKEIAGDAGNFILSIDLEQGSVPLAGIEIWSREIDAGILAGALKNEFQHEVEIKSLDTLRPMSEGLARRFLGTVLSPSLTRIKNGQPVLDLVPQPWRSTVIAQRVRRRLLMATVGVLTLWLLAMIAFFGVYQFQKYRLEKLEERLQMLKEPEQEVIQMQNKVKSFEQYLERKNSALECLREISRPLPKDILLTSFKFAKGRSAVIRGEALQVNAIYDYKKELDKSLFFAEIEMGAVKPGKRKDRNIHTFQMTFKLKEQP